MTTLALLAPDVQINGIAWPTYTSITSLFWIWTNHKDLPCEWQFGTSRLLSDQVQEKLDDSSDPYSISWELYWTLRGLWISGTVLLCVNYFLLRHIRFPYYLFLKSWQYVHHQTDKVFCIRSLFSFDAFYSCNIGYFEWKYESVTTYSRNFPVEVSILWVLRK